MRDIPPELLTRPFVLAEAEGLGLTLKVLQGKRFRSLFPRVYAHADLELTNRVRAHAALLALPPGSAASRHTGLKLWGVDTGPDTPLHIDTTHPHQVRLPGTRLHRVSDLGELWKTRSGLLIRDPATCWAGADRHLNLLELVTAGDRLLHLDRCTLADLRDTRRTRPARRTRARSCTGAPQAARPRLRRPDSRFDNRWRQLFETDPVAVALA